MFDFLSKIQEFEIYHKAQGKPYNNAVDYGVLISGPENPLWRVLGVHHLSPDENRGKHNVFIEVLRKQGNRDLTRPIHWTWKDRQSDQSARDVFAGDKPPNELIDLPLFLGMIVSVWTDDSEVASGFSSNHPDEGNGNTIGHHSFFVCFQEVNEGVGNDPPEEGETVLAIKKSWLDGLPLDDDGFVRVRG